MTSDRLVAEGLTRVAGRRHILRGVSLQAERGGLVALVGRNGAGKTTLLNVLSGRLQPDQGAVRLWWDNRERTGIEFRSRVALLPHDLFLYPELTARENLSFFAHLYGDDARGPRVQEALDRVGLGRDADRLVREFSRGMQQRAAVGRLLVTGAPVWLLDEPTTGLDSSGRHWLWDTMAGHASAGGVVVWSSHDAEEVRRLATRIVVLKAGRVVADLPGGPEGTRQAFEALQEAP